MTIYDFDKFIDREDTFSVKWDYPKKLFPESDLKPLPLWIADMDFPCSNEIISALNKRLSNLVLGYSSGYTKEYNNAVKTWFKDRFNFKIDDSEIFFSPGVVAALSYLIQSLTNEGNGIIIQKPVYYPFEEKIKANKRVVVNNPLVYKDGKYEIDFDDLEEKMSMENVKGMIFCSPHNPVGRVWTKEELIKLCSIAKKYDKFIISDEIHCDITRKGVTHTVLASLCEDYKHRIITCTSPSKSFNIAGLQISNIIIQNDEYKKLWEEFAIKKGALHGPNALAMCATIAAYNESKLWLQEINSYIDSNITFVKDYVNKNMKKVKAIDCEGTYLLWLDLSGYGKTMKEIKDLIQNKAKVILDEGTMFGKEGYGFERINVACPRSILKESLERIKNVLE